MLSEAGSAQRGGCAAASQVNGDKLGFGGFHFVSCSKLAQLKIACLPRLSKLSLLGVVAYLLQLTLMCVTGVQALPLEGCVVSRG